MSKKTETLADDLLIGAERIAEPDSSCSIASSLVAAGTCCGVVVAGTCGVAVATTGSVGTQLLIFFSRANEPVSQQHGEAAAARAVQLDLEFDTGRARVDDQNVFHRPLRMACRGLCCIAATFVASKKLNEGAICNNGLLSRLWRAGSVSC